MKLFKGIEIGGIAYLVGLFVTLALTLVPALNVESWMTVLVLVMAVVVGLINITAKETNTAVWVMIGLFLAGIAGTFTGFSQIPFIGEYVANILKNIGTYLTVICAIYFLKAGYSIMKKR